MSDKKLILICPSLAVGGAERHIVALSNGLVTHGYKVKILLLEKPKVAFPVDVGVEIVFLGARAPDFDLSGNKAEVYFHPCEDFKIGFMTKLRQTILKYFSKHLAEVEDQRLYLQKKYAARIEEYVRNYPDCIVVSFLSFYNVSTMMALRSLSNRGIFVDFTSPALEFPLEHPMNELTKIYYHRANGAIFQTPEERDFYGYLNCPKWVIPNPLMGEYPVFSGGERSKKIVTFSRISVEKNLSLLIDASSIIFDEYPDFSLHIYGDGSEKGKLIEYVKIQGLSDKVIFHDFDIALHDKIKDCAMFVSTSNREGISNSMLEAMAIGLPTICTDCPAGGARMMITPYENGILVPCGDKEALVNAMKDVIEHPELAEKMSRNSITIRERLHIDKIIHMWMEAIEGSSYR